MTQIEVTAEPLVGPNVIRATTLQLLGDGETIVLAIVCQSGVVADEVYGAIAKGLAGAGLRVADLLIRAPHSDQEVVHG